MEKCFEITQEQLALLKKTCPKSRIEVDAEGFIRCEGKVFFKLRLKGGTK